jgi:hypothetical protein
MKVKGFLASLLFIAFSCQAQVTQLLSIVDIGKDGTATFKFSQPFEKAPDCEVMLNSKGVAKVSSVSKDKVTFSGQPGVKQVAFECSIVPLTELHSKQAKARPVSASTIVLDNLAQALVNLGIDPTLASSFSSMIELAVAGQNLSTALINTSITNLKGQVASVIPLPATSYSAVSGAIPMWEWGPCIPQKDFTAASAGESFDYSIDIPAAGNYFLSGCVGTTNTNSWSLHLEYPIGTKICTLTSSSIPSPLTNWSVFRQVPCVASPNGLLTFPTAGSYTIRVVLETTTFNWGGLMPPMKQ